jgi:AraC-like DNA-binding protein
MASEQVRVWRPAGVERILLMAGRTASYALEPRGEYVFGIVEAQPMRSRRGRERRVVQPGQVVAWDPSAAHSGSAAAAEPWSSRLMIVESAGLAGLAGDREDAELPEVAFPEPVVSDPELARSFVRMHLSLDSYATRLERDERLGGWLRALVGRCSTVRARPAPLVARDERALRLARDYLTDRLDRNVGLDELAAAAGIGKFRLIRLVRERTGLPPHALQLAYRLQAARRRLEAGESIAATAMATGFSDQSHLHRHFVRSLGLAPGAYQRCFVQSPSVPPAWRTRSRVAASVVASQAISPHDSAVTTTSA